MEVHWKKQRGFTLLELMAGVVVCVILCSFIFVTVRDGVNRAQCVKDIGQMRQIGIALRTRAAENNGTFYTREEVGQSAFRVYEDKLGLCQILLPYLDDKRVWTSPKPHPRTTAYGNSYAWAINAKIVQFNGSSSLVGAVLLWNNHSYLTPSPMNYPDPNPNGGPTQASSAARKKPWRNGTAQNWLYADGHVDTH